MLGAKAEDIIGYGPIDSSGDGLGSATFQPSLLEHGADASGSRLLASAIRSR
jgi:hypothetical protein